MVDQLTACLPRVLTELDCADRDILTRCDIEGMTQQTYANQQGLSLPAVKSPTARPIPPEKTAAHRLRHVQLDDQGQVCCAYRRSPPRAKVTAIGRPLPQRIGHRLALLQRNGFGKVGQRPGIVKHHANHASLADQSALQRSNRFAHLGGGRASSKQYLEPK